MKATQASYLTLLVPLSLHYRTADYSTLPDFMCAAKRSAALQWALQFVREPTPTTRCSYFGDQRISLFQVRVRPEYNSKRQPYSLAR